MNPRIRLIGLLGVAAALGIVAYLRPAKPSRGGHANDATAAPGPELGPDGHEIPGAQSLLLRELARQSLALACARAGTPYVDAVLTPGMKPPPGQCEVTSDWQPGKLFTVRLKRGGQPVGETTLPLARGPGDSVPFERVAATLAPLIARGAFADAAGPSARTPATDAAGAVDPAVEAMLGRVDFFSAFRAARLLHAAVARDGESPARLAALARAYANLGESTRPMIGATFDVAFARALLYAEQGVVARPTDAAGYWARAYVRAMIGMPCAGDDVVKARALGGAVPAWGDAVDLLVRGDTVSLFRRLDAAEKAGLGSLVAHSAMRTVAFGGLETIAIRFADNALAQDPRDFAAMMVANDNSGVGNLHATTAQNPVAINRGFAEIAAWPELPATLRPAFQAATAARFDVPSQLKLRQALEAQPVDDGNPMPWAVLGTLARDCSLLLAERQILFDTDMLGVDATADFAAWWPLVQDHPAAVLVERYVRKPDAAAFARFPAAETHMGAWRMAMRATASFAGIAALRETLATVACEHSDATVYDDAEYLWCFRSATLEPSALNVQMARRVYAAAPRDTTALAAIVSNDWPAVKGRRPELLALADTAPHLGWRLGQRALLDGQPDEAIRILQNTATIAPSDRVYTLIADAYAAKGDLEGEVRTLEAFVDHGEDVGLSAAAAQERIARKLMLAGDAPRALPYARAGADSGAAWAMLTYADALGRNGQPAAARQQILDSTARYTRGDEGTYDLYLRTLLYPGMADPALDRWARSRLAAWGGPGASDPDKRHYAVVKVLDGQIDDAARVLATETGSDGLIGRTTLASLHLLRNDAAAATAVLAQIDAAPPDYNGAPHKAAVPIVRAILADGKAVPLVDTSAVLLNAASDNSKAAAAALIGLANENKGHAAEAEAWYRYALRSTGTSPGRVIAMTRLKRANRPLWP